MPYAGRFDVIYPGAGDEARLTVVLLDDDGAPVTGEAWDAAGMDVQVCPSGGTFAAFPDFATENWHECGHGVYELIIDGGEADEVALLVPDDEVRVRVLTDASSANTALHAYKVSPADVARTDDLSTAEANIRGADDDTLETLSDQIDAIDPSGAYVTTRTFVDGDGNAVADLKITVQSDDGGDASGTVIGKLTTSSSGAVTFNLDNGTYHFLSPSTRVWQASDTTVTVDGDNSTGDITVTAQTLPTPSSADKYTIIIDAADEYDDLVGADERSYKITSIYPAHDPDANLVRSTERNLITTDANGQASFEVGKNVQGGTLLESYTDEDGVERTVERRFVVDSDEADESDRIYFADIEVE